MRFSSEVDAILQAAHKFADGAQQSLTTGHMLLAMLKVSSRAGRILTELRLDLEKVLTALKQVKRADRLEDSDELLTAVMEHMIEAAHRSSAPIVSSLHLLLGITREKNSVAYKAFAFLGIPPVTVRTLALAGLNGPVPAPPTKRSEARAFQGEPASRVALGEAQPQAAPAPTRPAPRPQVQARAADPGDAEPPPIPGTHGAPHGPGSGLIGIQTVSAPAAPTPTVPADDPGAPWMLDPEQFPLLTGLGRNLTADAARGLIDPVIGRADTIDAILDILHKRRANNPCLVGEPGVGKTAIVEGLALAMLGHGPSTDDADPSREAAPEGRARALGPGSLREKVVIALDVGSLVAGTELRGAFSRRMAKLKDEVRAAGGRVIVFIDEMHTLVGAGSGEGALDAANDLKAALARGEFPCIGATTPQEYHRHIEKDPALERRFQPIEVEEPSEEDALAILQGVIDKYEAHHGVVFQPDALDAAVRMSRRYLVDRRLPDKAFNLVDTAAARVVRRGHEVVAVADIAGVVSELTKIPIARLLMTDAERILQLRDFLGEHIVGQDRALDAVTEVIQRNSAGFASRRPIGSFLFLGPSGVGKTETAKVLADFLFCSKDALTRFDMSEFMEKHAVARILGAAPGYVGHEQAGQLTAALARRPYQIILFDEIEKAHPDVLHILLQVLDEGRLTDAKGRVLSLSSTVILMTSNLGADVLRARAKKIGFARGGAGESVTLDEADLAAVMEAAKRVLPPELWGRVDEKCVYLPLGQSEFFGIARLLVRESSKQLQRERNIAYEVTDDVIAHVIEAAGVDPTLGARPLRRAVQRVCETAIARAVLRGDARPGDRLELQKLDGEIAVYSVTPAEDDAARDVPVDGAAIDVGAPDDLG